MRVKAHIKFKGKFKLTYIGRISKNKTFKFRNNQLRKACLNTLKNTFNFDCSGGSLTIPNLNNPKNIEMIKQDKCIICYICVVPHKENSKYLVTYWKNI